MILRKIIGSALIRNPWFLGGILLGLSSLFLGGMKVGYDMADNACKADQLDKVEENIEETDKINEQTREEAIELEEYRVEADKRESTLRDLRGPVRDCLNDDWVREFNSDK